MPFFFFNNRSLSASPNPRTASQSNDRPASAAPSNMEEDTDMRETVSAVKRRREDPDDENPLLKSARTGFAEDEQMTASPEPSLRIAALPSPLSPLPSADGARIDSSDEDDRPPTPPLRRSTPPSPLLISSPLSAPSGPAQDTPVPSSKDKGGSRFHVLDDSHARDLSYDPVHANRPVGKARLVRQADTPAICRTQSAGDVPVFMYPDNAQRMGFTRVTAQTSEDAKAIGSLLKLRPEHEKVQRKMVLHAFTYTHETLVCGACKSDEARCIHYTLYDCPLPDSQGEPCRPVAAACLRCARKGKVCSNLGVILTGRNEGAKVPTRGRVAWIDEDWGILAKKGRPADQAPRLDGNPPATADSPEASGNSQIDNAASRVPSSLALPYPSHVKHDQETRLGGLATGRADGLGATIDLTAEETESESVQADAGPLLPLRREAPITPTSPPHGAHTASDPAQGTTRSAIQGGDGASAEASPTMDSTSFSQPVREMERTQRFLREISQFLVPRSEYEALQQQLAASEQRLAALGPQVTDHALRQHQLDKATAELQQVRDTLTVERAERAAEVASAAESSRRLREDLAEMKKATEWAENDASDQRTQIQEMWGRLEQGKEAREAVEANEAAAEGKTKQLEQELKDQKKMATAWKAFAQNQKRGFGTYHWTLMAQAAELGNLLSLEEPESGVNGSA